VHELYLKLDKMDEESKSNEETNDDKLKKMID
jgi:hypothetical protein